MQNVVLQNTECRVNIHTRTHTHNSSPNINDKRQAAFQKYTNMCAYNYAKRWFVWSTSEGTRMFLDSYTCVFK